MIFGEYLSLMMTELLILLMGQGVVMMRLMRNPKWMGMDESDWMEMIVMKLGDDGIGWEGW